MAVCLQFLILHLQQTNIRMKFSLLFTFLCVSLSIFGQLKPQNGVIDSEAAFYALNNATIYVSPTKKLSNATILVKENKIIKVGVLLKIPKDAVLIDCKNKSEGFNLK